MAKAILVVAMLALAGSAWAQSEEEITAAVGEQLDAWTACIKTEALSQAKASTLPAETIADKAVAACADERQDLSEHLQKPPIGWNLEKADTELDSALQQNRPQILESIRKARS